jgi:KDO2-lipid IV(A) lauroyltransferase
VTRLALLLLRWIAPLPLVMVRALGTLFGLILYLLAGERRRVTAINLKLCFPELNDAQRQRLARAHFRAFAQSFVDRSWLWHAPPGRLRARIVLHNEALFTSALAAGKPVILLSPHFIGLDAGWTRLTLDRQMMSMYANQKNRSFNDSLRAGRLRFHDPLLLSRQQGIRAALKGLKRGLPFYYLPDMDFGPRDAIFVPFFGVPAATVPAIARISALAQAVVIPCVTRLTSTGYDVSFHPAWDNYPGDDLEAATRRMNHFIEEQVRGMPEQYLWVHKRFKTRPVGQERFY